MRGRDAVTVELPRLGGRRDRRCAVVVGGAHGGVLGRSLLVLLLHLGSANVVFLRGALLGRGGPRRDTAAAAVEARAVDGGVVDHGRVVDDRGVGNISAALPLTTVDRK